MVGYPRSSQGNLTSFQTSYLYSSPLLRALGVVKDWLLIAFSWSVIRDRVTAINLIGYLLAFVGVCWYNSMKLQMDNYLESQALIWWLLLGPAGTTA
ncbi:unnamed protein product [Closterium sp. NIES-53]